MELKSLKYTDILKLNTQLGKNLSGKEYKIYVLSNMIVNQLNQVIEYALRKNDINAQVTSGNYDNIVQDSATLNGIDAVIIFWEPANITDGLQYRINTMSDAEYEDIVNKVKAEMGMVLENLKNIPLLLMNKFTPVIFNSNTHRRNRLDQLCDELNAFLRESAKTNTQLIDVDKVITSVSLENAVDYRFFYSSKSYYTVDFFKYYAWYIQPYFLSVNGKAKKALIFDCDNTLWGGILGEDGFDGIKMSATQSKGIPFKEVQHLAVELSKKGVIIGLCSKNNPEDVNEVLNNHPDMVLKDEFITIKKVNWEDKVSNLKAIANELNIGEDSLVFVDDSDFEINFVKEQLPHLKSFQVPQKLYEYPSLIRSIASLFYNISQTNEDVKKLEQYKQQVKRENEKSKFNNLDDYLKSLELKLEILVDDNSIIPRMSQMTQKTNQFNLTTKRYTENDIQNFVKSPEHLVMAFVVKDKFGDNGITGLSIIEYRGDEAQIDSLLMSCRVIGRNIEYRFMDEMVTQLKERGVNKLSATYLKTIKNHQVEELFDKFGFDLTEKEVNSRKYFINLSTYKPFNYNYIDVNYGREN